MPTLIDSMPKVKRPGRKPKYDFTQQLKDGKPFLLKKGNKKDLESGKADYDCSTQTMRHNIYSYADNILPDTKRVSTVITEEGNAIAVEVVKRSK